MTHPTYYASGSGFAVAGCATHQSSLSNPPINLTGQSDDQNDRLVFSCNLELDMNNLKLAATWVSTELLGRLNKAGCTIENSPISPKQLAGLINLISDKVISARTAKDVLDEMFESGKEAIAIVEEKGLRQVVDTGAIEKVIDEVLAANPDKVAEYKSGKDKLFGFFVGRVMKASDGKVNPALANDLLRKKLL